MMTTRSSYMTLSSKDMPKEYPITKGRQGMKARNGSSPTTEFTTHKSPAKICVVFDCSAKPKGNSLNDQLMKDPDLTNSLLGVLSRFQQECIAVMADIKAIFHQVKIPNYNCLFLCFLYWPDGDLSYALAEYQMTLHLFGTVSSPACANFALRKMVDDNEQHFPCDMKNTVRHNFYVDECLKSLLSVTVAIIHVHELCSLLYCGDFRSTK